MSEPTCKRCGDDYELRFGEEPTEFCDRCAHLVIDELKERLETLERHVAACKTLIHCAERDSLYESIEHKLNEKEGLLDEIEHLGCQNAAMRERIVHPQIHLDFYDWLASLSEERRNYINTAKGHDVAMFAFSVSRELLRDKGKEQG